MLPQMSHIKFTFDRHNGISHISKYQPQLTEERLLKYQNRIFQKQNQVDSSALQEYLNSVKTNKIGKEKMFTEKAQITYIINNVYNLLKKMMIMPQNQNSFTKILSVYAQLVKSRENNRNQHFSIIQEHLKDVLNIDVHRKNKKLYMFISKVFEFNPYTVYKILQSKPEFLEWNSEQSSKIYKLFIQYASEKKNYNLILKQIKKCIEKEPQQLERLKILLTYLPETKNESLILSIYSYINQLLEEQLKNPKKQLQLSLLQTIKLFVSLPWLEVQKIKKDETIIKYLSFDYWRSQNCSKEVRHLLNDILLKLEITNETMPWITQQIKIRIKQLDNQLKDQTQNYRTLKILFNKLKKNKVQSIVSRGQIMKIINNCLNSQIRDECVNLLEQIKRQFIYQLSPFINQSLKKKIQEIFNSQKNVSREKSRSAQGQALPKVYTLQEKRLALKALRKYKFESAQVFKILKQHVLKSELINKSEQIKRQVIKVCLNSLTARGITDKEKLMSTILNLINKDINLKIITIKWFRENEALYDKKIFQIFKEPQYLNVLFQDYASNHMMLKRFSIKVLCFIYPLSPCEIVPFLKRVYYHIYDRLCSDNIVGFDEKKQALRLTREILRHRTEIICEDASVLCNFLYTHLYRAQQQYESTQKGQILIQLFKTIIDLIRKIPKSVISYAYPISNYIVKLINSKDYSQMVKTFAISCFNQLIRSCSYVLVPYFHFKNLFQIIREIFQQGARDAGLHVQMLRLLGNIGFITKDKYDRVKSLTTDIHNQKQINKIFEKVFKQTNYIRQIKNEKQIELIQSSASNGPYLFTKQETMYTYIELSSFKNYILFKINKIMSENPSKAINFMVFKVLQQLTPILNNEQQKMFQEIILIQVLKPQILKQNSQLVFSLINKIVRYQNTKENSNLILNYMVSLFQDKKMNKKQDLIQLIFILTYEYPQNPYKDDSIVRLIVSKITHHISKPGVNVDEIKIGLKIIQNLAGCINNLIHLFLPQFNKSFIVSNQEICLCYFEVLLQLCKKTQSAEFYLPPIKQSLIQLLKIQLEKSNTQSFFIQKIIDFVICLMLIYGDRLKQFITEFKKLIDQFSLHHLLFKIAVDYMKKHSTLNYLEDAFEKCEINQLQRKIIDLKIVKPTVTQKQYIKMTKRIVSIVIDEFNCDKNQIQDESEQWFNKICISLFHKSPQLFVIQCLPLVKQDRSFCYDIFPVAFYFFWNALQEEERKKLTNKLKIILQSKVISLSVKQKFLDTIYLMDQWKVPIPLSYKFSKEVCSTSLDSAKALFYLQSLFQKDPQIYGEQLIQMYAQLQQNQSAIGLLKIVQNLNIKTKIKLYKKLKRFYEALKEFDKLEDKVSLQPESILMQISIRKQMSDWESVHKSCNNQVNKNINCKQKFAQFAVEACINLGKWDQVPNWLESVPKNHQKVNLWRTMLMIHQKRYSQAQQYINLDRNAVYSKITQLFNFSFERVMEGVIRLQQLCQLQEATAFLKLSQQFHTEKQDEKDKRIKVQWMQHRKKLQNVWNDRIQGCKKNLNAMQVLLMTRNLLLTKAEDINNWIDYCHLALKQNQTQIAKKTLKLLDDAVLSTEVKKKFQIQTLLIETMFILDQLKDEEAVNLIQKNIQQKGTNKSEQFICRLYFNCAMWLSQKQYDFSIQKGNKCIQILKKSTQKTKNFIKGWHLMGLMHLKIDQLLQQKKKNQKKTKFPQQQDQDSSIIKQTSKQIRETHIFQALQCFIKSVSCGVKNHGFFLEDCLKIMNILFNQNEVSGLVEQLQKNYTDIPAEGLIDIIPQIIGRLDDIVEKPKLLDIMKRLLVHIGQNHPQALVFYLVFLKKCQNKMRENISNDIVKEISKKQGSSFNALFNDTEIIVKQLCKVSLKLNQKFKISIQKLIQQGKQKDPRVLSKKLLRICEKFKRKFQKQRQKQKRQNNQHLSISQFGFLQQNLQQLSDIVSCLEIYQKFHQYQFFKKAQIMINRIVFGLQTCLKSIKKITLLQTSPQLMKLTNTLVCIPGSYNPYGNNVLINSFNNQLDVISSKQRPKKLIINGSDSKQYLFLLKGKQDLRLDQRIMQLFNLINKMFHDPVQRQNYSIKGYSITPISLQTGIIEWVQNCDTIADLIIEYRKSTLGPNKSFLQRQISARICKDYSFLPKAHKVQIYKQIQSKVSGNDLKKIFWIRSSNSQQWLKNRSCYTRSLAVMSIVGYVIGLGDRHPHNIMIQRNTGKVVHIDFGDCFDVNKTRGQFPEKVPFRLTRMLVKNMQPCGIHGIFQHTCQKIIKMLRNNKESIIAIIEAFQYDPIIGWRLKGNQDQQIMLQNSYENNQTQQSFMQEQRQKDKDKEGDSKNKILGSGNFATAQHILNQIKKKLGGKAKNQTNKVMSPQQQVSQLIKEAMSPENLVQHFEGWSIYW